MSLVPERSIAAVCYQHPARAGIGICVECRNVVCAECSTQFEGINRCARCLARLAPKAHSRKPFSEWGALSIFGAVCSFGLLFGAVLFAAGLLKP